MMHKDEMTDIINRTLDAWLATTSCRKATGKAPTKPKPRSGGHNRLPKMDEEQKKAYRKLRVAGIRRGDALAAVSVKP